MCTRLFSFNNTKFYFLESHILEDVKTCVRAINESDPDTLDRIAGAIRGRSARVCNVVGSEMDNYEPCMYTERVLEAVKVLRDQGESLYYYLKLFIFQCKYLQVYRVVISFSNGFLLELVLPNFAQRVDVAVEALSSTPGKEVDENEFIDASHLVYDGVREIRMAVLMNKADDELDPDDVLMDEYHNALESRSKCKPNKCYFCSLKNIVTCPFYLGFL